MKTIKLSEYRGPLSKNEVERYVRSASNFYGITVPKYTVHEKYKVKDNFVVLGYYEHPDNELHFNIKPDKRLVFHEFGDYLYHKMFPGKCRDGSAECEEFAKKVEQFAVSPKGSSWYSLGPC